MPGSKTLNTLSSSIWLQKKQLEEGLLYHHPFEIFLLCWGLSCHTSLASAGSAAIMSGFLTISCKVIEFLHAFSAGSTAYFVPETTGYVREMR